MLNLNFLVDKYDLIMVDIDNTLFNYTYAHNMALKNVIDSFGFSIDDYDTAKKILKTRDLKVNHHKKDLYFKIICENLGIHFLEARKMYALYLNVFLKNIRVDKSMYNLLKCANKNNKIVVAITNFYFTDQVDKLSKMGDMIEFINFLVCSEEFEIEKPNFPLIDRVFELTNFTNREKIVMIGDSVADDLGIYDIDYYPYNCSKLLISISGKSGAGKTTLSHAISEVSPSTIISADGYHKYERNSSAWKRITHYNPEGNNLVQLALDIKTIYQNIKKINIPIYNHMDGTISHSEAIDSDDLDIVVIEGLHTLYKEVTGDFIKIKIFIESDESDKQKIKRDMSERGHDSEEKVKEKIQERERDYETYLSGQKDNSNFFINVKGGKFTIKLQDVLLNNDLQKEYSGVYSELIPRIKYIFENILNNRWIQF